ncbi:MAG: PIN domain-containing protein [Burkholderiaceae bacterium]|nr:PIN domain-containing protein [Burkholderiaceae bacterium]
MFFDTNVLASALTSRGLCAELYERIALGHDLIVGTPVIDELLRVLGEKLKVPTRELRRVRAELEEFEVAAPSARLPAVKIKDRDDLPVLACALAANVEIFVTGDKELLAIRAIEHMSVLSPRQLWEKLAKE